MGRPACSLRRPACSRKHGLTAVVPQSLRVPVAEGLLAHHPVDLLCGWLSCLRRLQVYSDGNICMVGWALAQQHTTSSLNGAAPACTAQQQLNNAPPPSAVCVVADLLRRARVLVLQDTLQDKWSPCHNICTVLMSIQSMLTDPNCSSPANPEAAQLYTKDRTAYNR